MVLKYVVLDDHWRSLQEIQVDHEDSVQKYSYGVRKANIHLELNLVKNTNGNKLLQVNQQQKVDEGKWAPLLKWNGDMRQEKCYG